MIIKWQDIEREVGQFLNNDIQAVGKHFGVKIPSGAKFVMGISPDGVAGWLLDKPVFDAYGQRLNLFVMGRNAVDAWICDLLEKADEEENGKHGPDGNTFSQN